MHQSPSHSNPTSLYIDNQHIYPVHVDMPDFQISLGGIFTGLISRELSDRLS